MARILDSATHAYPDATVTYAELPEMFSEKAELKTTIGGDADSDALKRILSQPLKAALTIEKPKKGGAGPGGVP